MEADCWQVCFFQQRLEPIYQFARIQGCSQRRTEDEVTLLPVSTSLLLRLYLTVLMLLSSFASSYELVMEMFPVFGQVEREHTCKDERIILAGSNIDAVGLRQAEPLL